MIPTTIEDVLSPNFYISPCLDNAELEAWLALLPVALQKVYTTAVERKKDKELSEHEFELTSAKEYLLSDDGINVTTRKLMAKANEKVVAAEKNKIEKSFLFESAEVLVKAIEAKSSSIRKIATIRANTQQFSETDYVVRRNDRVQQNQQPIQYPSQQPYSSNQYNPNQPTNFGQPNIVVNQPPQQSGFMPQPPQGNNSNYYPPSGPPQRQQEPYSF